jgi:drug/metabolite transporter (DMT)-like permease
MTRRSWLMMGGAAAVWGASYMFIKVALDDFGEGAIVCIRTALGAIVLLALARRWDALAPLRGRWPWVAGIAFVQVVIPFLLITFGENHIESQLAGILVSAAPIFTALLALGFDHDERSQGWAAVGIVVGMLGVVLLFGLDLSGSSDQLVGGLMVLAASLCYAVGAMLFKHKLPGAPPVGVAAGQMAVAAIATLPLCLTDLPTHAPSFKAVGALVLLGAAGTGIAFLWFYTLISEIGPARASVIAYIAPGFSVVYGVVLLDEGFSVAAVAGLGLILAGSWLAVGGRAKRGAAHDRAPAAPAPVQEACQAVESPAPVVATARAES